MDLRVRLEEDVAGLRAVSDGHEKRMDKLEELVKELVVASAKTTVYARVAFGAVTAAASTWIGHSFMAYIRGG